MTWCLISFLSLIQCEFLEKWPQALYLSRPRILIALELREIYRKFVLFNNQPPILLPLTFIESMPLMENTG